MGLIKDFLKKYAALVPPIGLLVLAVIFLLPTLWLGGKVKAQMSDSVKQAQTIRSLMSDVPSKERPAQLKVYMDRLESDAKQIESFVEQSSRRELVAYTPIFPAPTDTSPVVYEDYGRRYRTTIEGLLRAINALDAPSEAEIRAQAGGATRPAEGGYGMGGAARRPSTQDPMVDALCIARAEKISVYANPSAFAWYDFWQQFKFEGKDPALQDCWNSQIALWIYEDIVTTIEGMNTGSAKVTTSPVKRLLGISFNGPVQVAGGSAGSMYRMDMDMTGMGMGPGGQSMAAGRDNPNYVSPALPSMFLQQSWTGRVGGADYDIIHFAVSVVIDNRRVLDFMRQLCSEKEHTFREDFKADGRQIQSKHNQITILQNSVYVIDKASPQHELYRYGNGAVMQLDMVCEYLLSRKGYDSIKPEPVKKMLGQLEGQTDAAASPGGMGPMGGGMPLGF